MDSTGVFCKDNNLHLRTVALFLLSFSFLDVLFELWPSKRTVRVNTDCVCHKETDGKRCSPQCTRNKMAAYGQQ